MLTNIKLSSTAFAVAVFASACGTPTADLEDTPCPQTFEFGNFGCARVAGEVVRLDNSPVAGIDLSIRAITDLSEIRASGTTDSAGSFLLQITLWQPAPDTVDTHLVVAETGVGPLDSVPVRLIFAEVGETPPLAETSIVLQTSGR